MKFKNWLYLSEMAYLSKEPIYLDEEDIKYLKQFPIKFWTQALKLRYNDFILEALRKKEPSLAGSVASDWSDIKDVNLTAPTQGRGSRMVSFDAKINTGIVRLLQKLKKLGYDFSGTNFDSKTSLYYGLLTMSNAYKLKTNLLKTVSPKNLNKYKKIAASYRDAGERVPLELLNILDIKPNVVRFTPNYLQSNRHDPEPGNEGDAYYESLWKQLLPEVNRIINNSVKNLLKFSRNKANVLYWYAGGKDSHGQTIAQQLYNYIRLNWKNLKHDNKSISMAVQNKISTITQSGVLPRRLNDKLNLEKLDVFEIMNKLKWSPFKMKEFIESSASFNDLVVALKKLKARKIKF